jgi:hypothetical protein
MIADACRLISVLPAKLTQDVRVELARNVKYHLYEDSGEEHLRRLGAKLLAVRNRPDDEYPAVQATVQRLAAAENSKVSNVFHDPEFSEMVVDVLEMGLSMQGCSLLSVNILSRDVIGSSGWVSDPMDGTNE